MKKLLLLMAIPFFSSGKITPEITTPDRFSELSFYQRILSRGDYLANTADCKIVSLKLFYPSADNKYPSSGTNLWLCLFSVEAVHNGYGPGQALPEKVYLDKKTGIWKKKKYTLSRESTQRSLEVYGIKSLSELQPLELYNIQSVNARGYAVINTNIPLQEKQKGVKKKLSFCLIQNQSYFAFCGSRSMISLVDGKEVDFTPYMLKSLETVEMGLPENAKN
ncbi:hypothetical protein DLR11_19255 [Salmonella enterica subsp. salamae]|uniref:Uncharacterized protein n=1 Tax=Salmonella enterica subsp. salamae TaxID=59202 RepID=A0A5Y3V1Z6_SALER|nr:hypothetical protein [Salmonella enterica subsp. salamae]EDH0694842.1 hypothetical protein [Salmonella enterica]EHM1752267.1 hypothetical protein [Salmonella enterica subsp. salamae serovar 40:c:e,n,x,z15]ECI3453925.1 hypothetical protein [Salmonella enterica subsp. salamae]ECJ2327780.1 hypothetical protein [Salmonella enterica subsp. salamae]